MVEFIAMLGACAIVAHAIYNIEYKPKYKPTKYTKKRGKKK